METMYVMVVIAALGSIVSLGITILNRKHLMQRRLRNGFDPDHILNPGYLSRQHSYQHRTQHPTTMEKPVELDPERLLKNHLTEEIRQSVIVHETAARNASDEEISDRINERLKVLKDRLTEIEKRYPDEGSIERTVSVNEALISERIDQLAVQTQALEAKMLSRWDVAMIVSTVLTGILSISGGTYAVFSALNLLAIG
ncbi:MAG: hypothetical protein WD397_13265 [Wenzhouxiangellaceae bacterium]